MVQKVYKKLAPEDIARGVIFQSTLSTNRTELKGDITHEVMRGEGQEGIDRIERLKNDRFFNNSLYNYNIIRTITGKNRIGSEIYG